MDNHWPAIEEGYNNYLDRYPEEGMVQINGVKYPFQDAINKGNGSIIDKNEGDLERECLVSFRSDIPSITQLPLEDLTQMPIGLARILKIQRTHDHDRLWAFVADLLSALNRNNDPLHDQLVQNIELLTHAVHGGQWEIYSHFPSRGTSQSSQQYILNEAAILARYMIYPTIEGVIKSLCRKDIKMDGIVRSGRIILRYDSSDPYAEGDRCNNIGHLLWHLEQEAGDGVLCSRMSSFREAYAEFFEEVQTDRVYGHITQDRNTSLHGEERARAEFGMLLNLVALIILNIDHIPEERRITL